jgi:DNA-binding NarL/FixJ family response regulator
VNPVRILLVDDHVLIRSGLKSLLQTIEGIEVVAEAGDGLEAIALAQQHRPDVVMMDITMGELNGLQAAARLSQEQPEVRVVILSMHESEEYVSQALRAGVAGYMLKDAAPLELELGLQAVMRGETYLSPRISTKLVRSFVEGSASLSATENALQLLSPRQREILKAIAEGKATKQIAWELGVSVKTVETHRGQIMDRLGLRDIAGLVRFAVRVGLISPES